jgi:GTPase SAR1 family protein
LKELKSNSNPDVKLFLVGNKVDLEDDRIVTTEEAENLVNDLEFDYFLETSAKTGFNAEKIFVQAAKLLYTEYKELKKTKHEQKPDTTTKLDDINNIMVKKKRKCC